MRSGIFAAAGSKRWINHPENCCNQAGYIQQEIKYVLDLADEQEQDSIFIIPVRLEDCPVPDRLRHLHWINFFEPNGFERLMNSLRRQAHSIGLTQTTNKRPHIQSSEKRPWLTTTAEFATVGAFILALLAFLGYSTYNAFWNNNNQQNIANSPTTTLVTPGFDAPTATSTLTPDIPNTPASPTETQIAAQPSQGLSPPSGDEAFPAPNDEIGASPMPSVSMVDIANADPEVVPNAEVLSAGSFEYSFGSELSNVATASYGGSRPLRGKYLIVLLWVRNTGSTPAQIPDGFFVVKYPQGVPSNFDRTASVDYFNRLGGAGSAGDFGADSPLPPGAPLATIPLLFDIGTDATNVVLFSRDNLNQGFRVR